VNVRKAAAASLDRFGEIPREDAAAVTFWAARGQWDRCARMGTRAVEPLIGLLGDSDEAVRSGAVEALGTIGAPAVDSLMRAYQNAMNDPQTERVCGGAAEALIQIGRSAVEPLIGVVKECPSSDYKASQVRWYAVDALGQIGDLRAIEPLTAVWDGHIKDVAARDHHAGGRR